MLTYRRRFLSVITEIRRLLPYLPSRRLHGFTYLPTHVPVSMQMRFWGKSKIFFYNFVTLWKALFRWVQLSRASVAKFWLSLLLMFLMFNVVVVDPKVHQRNKKSAQVNAASVSKKRMNHVESFHFTNCQNFAACASRQNSTARSVVISFTICNQTRVHCFFHFHPKL